MSDMRIREQLLDAFRAVDFARDLDELVYQAERLKYETGTTEFYNQAERICLRLRRQLLRHRYGGEGC